jgi:hypothetical protein
MNVAAIHFFMVTSLGCRGEYPLRAAVDACRLIRMVRMGRDDGVARELVVVEATRRALLDRCRSAWLTLAFGVVLMLIGGTIEFAAWTAPLGLTPIMYSGIGLVVIAFGFATVARAVWAYASSRRRLRELAARTQLPVARVRAGGGAGGSSRRGSASSSR